MQKQTCKLGTGLLYEFGTILIFLFILGNQFLCQILIAHTVQIRYSFTY